MGNDPVDTRVGRARSVVAGAAVASLAVLLGACNWPMFGFDAAHTGDNSTATAIGRANVGTLVEGATTAPVAGQISSSPTAANGILYETAELGAGGNVGTLFAYAADGSGNCSRRFPLNCRPLWTATPAGAHGLITSPAIDTMRGVVYVGSADGVLYAYNAFSGTLEWESPFLGGSVGASPTITDEYVYLPMEYGWTDVFPLTDGYDGNNSSCLTRGTGLRVCRPGWRDRTPGDGFSSPAVANGIMYANSGTPTFTLYAYDAELDAHCSGVEFAAPLGATCANPLWTAGTGSGTSSPAVAGDVVYIGSTAQGLLAFSADGSTGCTGTPYAPLQGMTCTPLWTGGTGRQNGSSPAVADGLVYIGGRNGTLYAFDTATHMARWTAATGGTIDSAPVIANGVVYVGCSNQYEPEGQTCGANLYGFDATTGQQLWAADSDGASGTIDNSPIVVDIGEHRVPGAVFVGSSSGPSECIGTTACSGRVVAFALP
jgi:outer membrane protein assembly factor BamB